MKRFYTLASSTKTDEGFRVDLDGKPVKTPLGRELTAPTKALADAIAAEWGAQEETIDLQNMVLTHILTTAIDKAGDRDAITKTLTKYLDTDLLCYRTKEPEELSAKQKEIWDPWLAWFYDHFEVPLDTTFSLDALEQDEEAHKRVWNYIESLDEFYFSVLQIVTSLSGSVVLGLAFVQEEATSDEVFEAAQVEELFYADLYNAEKYGPDPQQDKQQSVLKQDLEAAKVFLSLLHEE